ncbi:TPA: phosphonopyruvate decarboxylase [Patescibacteria group bacterium]|uniref:Phosphonopyruvate decarboxylase n=1 Tax=Candidatus Woykebacteria bacterium GWA1_44_8 TaxID=1802591 RepID=A0A1G1W5G1_9BACT|nr:MAG: phosphonopyruvate decarboxylase [Candidatus Woykebacteria bacterium GWA1_44_8]HCR42000.1 phosphonopyruvate decarboxylase [Patescibacteria group bacterium]
MSLNSQTFYRDLQDRGIEFFVGVPDSTLKYFCSYITDTVSPNRHIITANEGGAIALAAGYYLATQKIPLVYMQNSGLGNAVNPLTSLVDSSVYGIPMLLMIGWRGEPGVHDEPQHAKQGKITLQQLDVLGIPYAILSDTEASIKPILDVAMKHLAEQRSPYALVVRKDTFAKYSATDTRTSLSNLLRERAVANIIDNLDATDIVVSTTGMTSRELFEYRASLGQGHQRDFLTVGSMGHASQIALGIALHKPDRQVYCLDGDGAAIMHMGAMAIIGTQKPANFKHIVINNGAHESVGGQPTAGQSIDLLAIAQACGYSTILLADNTKSLQDQLQILKKATGPAFLEVRVAVGHRDDLGRPTITPQENKQAFINFLQ